MFELANRPPHAFRINWEPLPFIERGTLTLSPKHPSQVKNIPPDPQKAETQKKLISPKARVPLTGAVLPKAPIVRQFGKNSIVLRPLNFKPKPIPVKQKVIDAPSSHTQPPMHANTHAKPPQKAIDATLLRSGKRPIKPVIRRENKKPMMPKKEPRKKSPTCSEKASKSILIPLAPARKKTNKGKGRKTTKWNNLHSNYTLLTLFPLSPSPLALPFPTSNSP